MCLLVMAIDHHSSYRLVIAENRDEFYRRPTAPAEFWDEASHVLAGRDLERGGTWFGVTTTGCWAAVTNFRDFYHRDPGRHSRGGLVSRFLRDGETLETMRHMLEEDGENYAGLNFLAGDRNRVLYISNKDGGSRYLDPGVYGLSNHWLDTPWPKVVGAKADFSKWLQSGVDDIEPLFTMLADRRRAPQKELPDTGIGLEWERELSARFIQSEDYGTRTSTVYLVDRRNRATFIEKTFDETGRENGRRQFTFELNVAET